SAHRGRRDARVHDVSQFQRFSVAAARAITEPPSKQEWALDWAGSDILNALPDPKYVAVQGVPMPCVILKTPTRDSTRCVTEQFSAALEARFRSRHFRPTLTLIRSHSGTLRVSGIRL